MTPDSTNNRSLLWILACMVMVKFFSEMVFSLQGPLYPREAQSKNASATFVGLVMGIYQLGAVTFTPFGGKLIPLLGVSCAVTLSAISIGVSTIAFGLLDWINSTWIFIVLSCVCRLFEAFGAYGLIIATNSFCAAAFDSGRRGFILGVLDSLTNVSVSIGPFLGCVLYEVGGYLTPFMVVGGILTVLGIAAYPLLRKSPIDLASLDDQSTSVVECFKLMRIVPIATQVGVVFITAVNIGFTITLLEIHLRQFVLTPIQVGLVFLLNGVVSAATSPIACAIASKLEFPDVVPFGGGLLNSLAFALIGPIPLIPMAPSLPFILTSVALLGIGCSMTFPVGFVLLLKEAIAAGYRSDDTSIIVQLSTLWATSAALGLLCSSLLSGILFDAFEFRKATFFPFAFNFSLVVYLLVYIYWKKVYYNRSEYRSRMSLLLK